jgi:hypothetical protein
MSLPLPLQRAAGLLRQAVPVVLRAATRAAPPASGELLPSKQCRSFLFRCTAWHMAGMHQHDCVRMNECLSRDGCAQLHKDHCMQAILLVVCAAAGMCHCVVLLDCLNTQQLPDEIHSYVNREDFKVKVHFFRTLLTKCFLVPCCCCCCCCLFVSPVSTTPWHLCATAAHSFKFNIVRPRQPGSDSSSLCTQCNAQHHDHEDLGKAVSPYFTAKF